MNKKTPTENAKFSAIAAYFTFIGLIIAFFVNIEEKHEFANFHIRQSLSIQTLFYATGALLGLFPSTAAGIGFLVFFFIIWIFGFATALKNQTTPLPIVGGLFQKLFSFIK
ncbi:hypothetical protein [Aquimarina agarivorans]|uniref:hypothetical protein n=1 Tax=Aquimarina agarivorans TaxID=980584 RepID=UPI000248FC82|nr:hypothetical protein [Aquimarina agarivorans]